MNKILIPTILALTLLFVVSCAGPATGGTATTVTTTWRKTFPAVTTGENQNPAGYYDMIFSTGQCRQTVYYTDTTPATLIASFTAPVTPTDVSNFQVGDIYTLTMPDNTTKRIRISSISSNSLTMDVDVTNDGTFNEEVTFTKQ